MPSDSISEVIAHFIGCFDIRVDEMRMRHAYEEFHREQSLTPAEPVPYLSPSFFQHLQLDLFTPGVSYHPILLEGTINFAVPPIQIAVGEWHDPLTPLEAFARHGHYTSGAGAVSYDLGPRDSMGPDPTSVIFALNQVMLLDDNDFISLGSIDVGAINFLADAQALESLLQAGLSISSALGGIEAPAQEDDIPAYFSQAHASIADIAADHGTDGAALFTATSQHQIDGITATTTTVLGTSITGTYVNGALATDAPSLLESLPAPLQEVVAEAESEPSTSISLTIEPGESSMTVQSGANMMINEALIGNAGLTSAFLAVAGDYHSINAIIQTNVHSDVDVIGSNLPGIAGNGQGGTASFNTASFAAELRDDAAEAAAANPNLFPSHWQLSVVEGDMVFLDWITQYSFTTDSDTLVLSAVGSTTTITSGENLGLNGVSFLDLGHYYDLIIVGGSLYDGNFIVQTNVLYDNDMLAMLSGMAADGTASTSGNLLWNSASIVNVGAGNLLSGMPDPYANAIASLEAGDYAMPASFSGAGTFEGFGALRVLYISGDVYDLHSVHQVNVMGDADLVALYQDNLVANQPTTTWDISTGSNALINAAAIIDYDSVGSDVQVGGQIYSDAILIQADLVAGSDAAPLGNDALVSEIVAFLDIDDMVPGDMDTPIAPMSDSHGADIMQSMLA